MSSDSSSSSDTYSDYYDDEDDYLESEPTQWSRLKDGWQEFLEDETAFFVVQNDSNQQGGDSGPIDDRERFYDPLGILKMPPRKSQSIKKELLSLESEDFSPVVFLSEIHSQTKFTELSVGMSKLKEALSSKALEIKFLVKDNFEHFVKCKDTVDEVFDLVSNSKMLEDMNSSFTKIIDKSSHVYHPLLRGKQEADHIRRVLTLLNKFKVIFKLPGKIQENIRQGEFEKVVHNYRNAKMLITSNNQKKAFQKILQDIERIIEDFRTQLFTILRDPQSKPDLLKKSIKVLMEIGNGKNDWSMIGDPCWYFLSNRNNAITTLIQQCSNDKSLPNYKIIRKLSILLLSNVPNLFKMGKSYIEGKFDDNSEYLKMKQQKNILQQAQQNQHQQQQQQQQSEKKKEVKTVSVIVYFIDESFSSYRLDQEKRVGDLVELCKKRFIETEEDQFCLYKLSEKKPKDGGVTTIKLVELALDDSPFKLQKKWIDKSSSKTHKFLFKKKGEDYSTKLTTLDSVHVVQKDLTSSYKSHKKQNSAATSAVNEENFKKLIIGLLELYSHKVEELFFDEDFNTPVPGQDDDDDEGNVQDTSSNMVDNVNEVMKCQEMLHNLGMDEYYLQSINKLVESLTLHFISQICSEMVAEVSFLYLLEDWSINEFDDVISTNQQVGGMTTTKLLGEFVETIKSNLSKLSFLANKPLLLSPVESALCEAIESFGDCLHHMAFEQPDQFDLSSIYDKNNRDTNNLSFDDDDSHDGSGGGGLSRSSDQITSSSSKDTFSANQKLLLILSNCSTVVSKTAVQLRSFYVSLFHQPFTSYIKKVIEKLGVLERLILDKYVNEKTKVLGEHITRGILHSGNIWMDRHHPVKVNDYILAILTKLVFVHNEVMKTINSIDVSFAVVSRVFEFLLVNIRHQFSFVEPNLVSNEGKAQFLLDVLFIENILQSFGSEKTVKLSQLIRKDLSFNPTGSGSNTFNPAMIAKNLDPILQRNLAKTTLLFSCFTQIEK